MQIYIERKRKDVLELVWDVLDHDGGLTRPLELFQIRRKRNNTATDGQIASSTTIFSVRRLRRSLLRNPPSLAAGSRPMIRTHQNLATTEPYRTHETLLIILAVAITVVAGVDHGRTEEDRAGASWEVGDSVCKSWPIHTVVIRKTHERVLGWKWSDWTESERIGIRV